MMTAKARIAVALSGGVDSSVAAALLIDQGYEVLGITLRFWLCDELSHENACCGIDGINQARAAAGALNIPHFVVDCREAFEKRVLRPAWNDYAHGVTPNPCIHCNREIKFGFLLEQARSLGAEKVATGHHAVLEVQPEEPSPALVRGRDQNKDQSYFLFALSPEQLSFALMPVGHLTKDEVRQEAKRRGLPNAARAESQDACFGIGGDGFAEALRKRFAEEMPPGDIVDMQGRVLGRHNGIHRYTIGQRKGLGVAVGQRAWIQAIDVAKQRIVLSSEEKHLQSRGLIANRVSWLIPAPQSSSLEAEVQIRYRHLPVRATIFLEEHGRARVLFDEQVRAITPGQAAVFYQGKRVIGGGWIERALDDRLHDQGGQ